jgi:cytochrome P450
MMNIALVSPFPIASYYIHGFWSPSWRTAQNQMRTFLQRRINDQRAAVAARKAMGDTSETADSVLEMIFEREGKDSPETMPDDELIDELALFLLYVLPVLSRF